MLSDREQSSDESLADRLAQADRQIRRERLAQQIHELGGMISDPNPEIVSEEELAFLEHVLAWETGLRSTHRAWLARHGWTFMPPAELDRRQIKAELWRLIAALAVARVFLYHTNHLSDAELYHRLWQEVLAGECPNGARTPADACHWDFADAGSGEELLWLRFYASEPERAEWKKDFPDTIMPERCRPPYRRDHRLPQRD